jgi:hypothetical protein
MDNVATRNWTDDLTVSAILARITPERRSGVLLSAGYFESTTGVGEFSLASFAFAHEVGRRVLRQHHGNVALYDVIQNDLGMSCGLDACAVGMPTGADAADQTPLRNAAADAGIAFTVTRERTLRNRAVRALKLWLADPASNRLFFLDGDGIYFRSRQYERVLVGVRKDNYAVPRCPMIVQQYYVDYFARLRRLDDCATRCVVDVSLTGDKDKVLKGAEIYLRTQGREGDEIITVFASGGMKNAIDLTLSADAF